MKKERKAGALTFIFITLLLDIIGFGIIIPVMPQLISELINGDVVDAAKYGGWLSMSYAVMQFLFASLLGGLSDRFGRRPVLLFSMLGFACNLLIQGFAPNITWLFLGRMLSGATGASITTASAYIADVSTDEDRAKNFGLIGAAFGIGFVIGPLLGGVLGGFGTRVPFFVAAVLCILNVIYGFYALPESLKPENRRPFDWKRANPVGSLLQLRQYPKIHGLVAAMVLVNIGLHATQTNWTFFTMYKFGWDERMIGISLGVVGLIAAFVQGFLIRFIEPKIGAERSIVYGLILSSLAMLLYAFAGKEWMFFAIMLIGGLGGIAGPALQSVVTSQVPRDAQGELQGALTSLSSLTAVVGPPLMTNTFYYFTHDRAPFIFPGAAFFLGFILIFISAILAYLNFRKDGRATP